MNICQCGTEAGYPHKVACPFAYYRTDAKGVANWQRWQAYEVRVQAYEAEGMTRSDAQGCVDAELMQEQRVKL